MIKLIDLNYHVHATITNPHEALEVQKASTGFVKFIKNKLEIQLVKHIKYEGVEKIDSVDYFFFKSKRSFWKVPAKTHRFVKKQHADVVLIQGFIFPIQVIVLKLMLGKKVKFMLQHHGERIFTGPKRIFQRLTRPLIDAYLFTSVENANDWIEKKIISSKDKCYEVLEASTHFSKMNKENCKAELNMHGNKNFLWVGRLNSNKDPLTVLKAFAKYLSNNREAKLYMIYQTDELLSGIKKLVSQNSELNDAVILKGSLPHHELQYWYSAANFYISGSRSEGSGYALIEAMACGCIPVVTDIPSFNKITNNGKYGFLFESGDEKSLEMILSNLYKIDEAKISASIVEHFNSSLSFQAISNQLYNVCRSIINK